MIRSSSIAILAARAKIGFCNCLTGVEDDAELERLSDFVLMGSPVAALGDGRTIKVAWMEGRSRAYQIAGSGKGGKSALSIAFNNECDAMVASAVLEGDRPAARTSRDRVSQRQDRRAVGQADAWPVAAQGRRGRWRPALRFLRGARAFFSQSTSTPAISSLFFSSIIMWPLPRMPASSSRRNVTGTPACAK